MQDSHEHENLATIAVRPSGAAEAEGVDTGSGMAGFFIVGAVINVAIVVAYFAWATRQWRRKDR